MWGDIQAGRVEHRAHRRAGCPLIKVASLPISSFPTTFPSLKKKINKLMVSYGINPET